MMEQALTLPNAQMMALVEAVASFMETLEDDHLSGVFCDGPVTIIENFEPHIFVGCDAVSDWKEGFRSHAEGLSDLCHTFGPPQDFSSSKEAAFFTLPTIWTGRTNGDTFREAGGWAFVFGRQMSDWRIKGYGWAVTEFSYL